MSRTVVMFVVLMFAAALMSCSDKDTQKAATVVPAEPLSAPSMELDGQSVSLGGITFTPPSEWRDFGPSGMRKADYAFGPVGSDVDSATLSVYYFGKESGGSVEDNIKRWIGQMTMPDGGKAADNAERKTYKVAGLNAHMVKVAGIYNAGGMMMGSAATPKEGYLMEGVVLEAPEGNVFFKLTGPEAGVEAMSHGFMAMLSQITVDTPAAAH